MAVILASILPFLCLLSPSSRVAAGLIRLDDGGVLIQALTSLSGPVPEEVETAVALGAPSERAPRRGRPVVETAALANATLPTGGL